MSYYIIFNYLQCILTYIYVDKSKQRAKYALSLESWMVVAILRLYKGKYSNVKP